MRKPKRSKARIRSMDLRGLTSTEQLLGAVVVLGRSGRYIVTAVDKNRNTATLEPLGKQKQDNEP